MLIIQRSLASDPRFVFRAVKEAWRKRADSWEMDVRVLCPHPTPSHRSVLLSHHSDRKQRPSHCPYLRLGLTSLNFIASPSGVCSAYSAHRRIQKAGKAECWRSLAPSLPVSVAGG